MATGAILKFGLKHLNQAPLRLKLIDDVIIGDYLSKKFRIRFTIRSLVLVVS